MQVRMYLILIISIRSSYARSLNNRGKWGVWFFFFHCKTNRTFYSFNFRCSRTDFFSYRWINDLLPLIQEHKGEITEKESKCTEKWLFTSLRALRCDIICLLQPGPRYIKNFTLEELCLYKYNNFGYFQPCRGQLNAPLSVNCSSVKCCM